MRRALPVLLVLLASTGSVHAQGHLVPSTAGVPPLRMVSHEVNVALKDQVAVTKVVQIFRNDTSAPLEATYVFPVPRGASVKKFVMWVDGKEVPGELVEADKARQIYTDIVRRTQDPGLLEYVGNNLLRVRVFPVPAHGDQKLAISFTSIATSDTGLVEYVYPLRAEAKANHTLDKFSFAATIKAQHPIQNVYSPSHDIKVTRVNDRHTQVKFESSHANPDRDVQLYYTAAAKDVGLTTLLHHPGKGGDGHFMMLISPRAELAQAQQVSRDMVFVLDTSGSMQGQRIIQAKKALKFCLRNLNPKDRFAVVHFSTGVTRYKEALTPANRNQIDQAVRWVDDLQVTGGTNINDALLNALDLRSGDTHRCFTMVFFTDGQPTVGEQNPDRIVKNVLAKNSACTRIFTFGVGDDVNAVLLDQLAEKTRSVATYVREHEDIETKVGGLYAKISNPVLTDLKLVVGDKVKVTDIYPPQLPDLFHGSQVVVLGRYTGKGHTTVTLTGAVGADTKNFIYEVDFPAHTKADKGFVEDLWARRKVGYLLDQIRVNGENKELVDEVTKLAKKHGITTPYTSYLVVPDAAAPVARGLQPQPAVPTPIHINNVLNNTTAGNATPPGLGYAPMSLPTPTSAPPMQYYAAPAAAPAPAPTRTGIVTKPSTLRFYSSNTSAATGKAGVDLSENLRQLRDQSQVGQATTKQAHGRTCHLRDGVWTDERFDAKQKQVTIKALSEAYFRLLELFPEMRDVFQLGQRVVWVTPSGTALVIHDAQGSECLTDAALRQLFATK